MAGIGKVALYGREYLVKVQPRERGLVMYTMRHANEIRSMDAIDELGDMPATIKPAEVKLAQQVIGTFEGDVDFQSYRDEYQEGLREIIDAKIEGGEPDGGAQEEPRFHPGIEQEVHSAGRPDAGSEKARGRARIAKVKT